MTAVMLAVIQAPFWLFTLTTETKQIRRAVLLWPYHLVRNQALALELLRLQDIWYNQFLFIFIHFNSPY